jgi:uncharacterized membrane protein
MGQKTPDKNIVLDMDMSEFTMLAAILGYTLEQVANNGENKDIYLKFIELHNYRFNHMISRVNGMMIAMRQKP